MLTVLHKHAYSLSDDNVTRNSFQLLGELYVLGEAWVMVVAVNDAWEGSAREACGGFPKYLIINMYYACFFEIKVTISSNFVWLNISILETRSPPTQSYTYGTV